MVFSYLDGGLDEERRCGNIEGGGVRAAWEAEGTRWIPVVGEEVAQRHAYHSFVFTEWAQRKSNFWQSQHPVS